MTFTDQTSTPIPGPAAEPDTGVVSKWDRPRQRDWRWAVGGVGRTLIASGLLMFAFVAYQLWGTAIEHAAAQNALESDFEAQLAATRPDRQPPPYTSTNPTTPTATSTGGELTGDRTVEFEPVTPAVARFETADALPLDEQTLPDSLDNGDALVRLEIPTIGLNDIVVAGVDTHDLKSGPGHFANTPLPGQLGNAAIAGHRTTYGQPFHNLDDLNVGDPIDITTLTGTYRYRVTDTFIVQPSQYEVITQSDPEVASLTLVTCHPKYTARQRLIVTATLDATASNQVGEPIYNYGRPDPAPDDPTPTTTATPDAPPTTVTTLPLESDTTPADPTTEPAPEPVVALQQPPAGGLSNDIDQIFNAGWFNDPATNPHIAAWGTALAAIAIAAHQLSRRYRRDLLGAAIGIGPFIVVLYFFFQNVNRLLPPNL